MPLRGGRRSGSGLCWSSAPGFCPPLVRIGACATLSRALGRPVIGVVSWIARGSLSTNGADPARGHRPPFVLSMGTTSEPHRCRPATWAKRRQRGPAWTRRPVGGLEGEAVRERTAGAEHGNASSKSSPARGPRGPSRAQDPGEGLNIDEFSRVRSAWGLARFGHGDPGPRAEGGRCGKQRGRPARVGQGSAFGRRCGAASPGAAVRTRIGELMRRGPQRRRGRWDFVWARTSRHCRWPSRSALNPSRSRGTHGYRGGGGGGGGDRGRRRDSGCTGAHLAVLSVFRTRCSPRVPSKEPWPTGRGGAGGGFGGARPPTSIDVVRAFW